MNNKGLEKVVNAYHDGRLDAIQNNGNQSYRYHKLEREAYKNGYTEGQLTRANLKSNLRD